MKLAVISDVHGNYPALQAAIADAKTQGAAQYLFLGDYYMYLPDPNACVDAIRALPGAVCVLGNQEDYLRGLEPAGKTDGQMRMLYWACAALHPDNRDWICNLPETIDLELAGVELHLAHSSQAFVGAAEYRAFTSEKFFRRYGNAPVSRAKLLADVSKTLGTDVDFLDSLECMAEGVYLFGHNHIQWHGDFDGRLFVNPGSCGLPLDMEQGAPYTLLHLDHGRARVEERRAAYDVPGTIGALLASDMNRQAPVWTQLMGAQLREAREYAGFFLRFAARYAEETGDPVRPYSVETWEKAYRLWAAENPGVFPVES